MSKTKVKTVYACPVCGNHETLEVSVTCWAVLNQADPENVQTDSFDADDGSHEWDGKSLMACKKCSHTAPAAQFDKRKKKSRKPSRRIKSWNEPRAEWAEEACEVFQAATNVDDEDLFCDLLCDLMHLAQREGIDFDHELERGLHHYEYEKDHED